MPYVLVQPDGAPEPVKERWRTPPPHVPDAEQDLKWIEVCDDLVSLAAGKCETTSFNVFLLLDRIDLFEDRNQPAIERLIRSARERCWGARLLLVLSKVPSIARIPVDERAAVTAWMNEVLAGRVCDILQINVGVESTTKDALHIILRNRAAVVTERQTLLFDAPGHRPWRCALPASRLDTASVLGPELATTKTDGQEAFDLVVLVAGSTRGEREGEISRHLAKDLARRRRYRVVTYDPDCLLELQDFCQRREIGPPLVLGGDFELWYLLLRLNEQAKSTWREVESIHPVPAPSPRLTVPNDRARLTILLTSTFGASEKCQWLFAATDVGKLMHISPAIDFRVELVIDTRRLLQILKKMPPVIDAWIHIGHGSGRDGLWVPDEGNVSPDQWADCFGEKELRLVMFLTCFSGEIARHLASRGAGVAIGFEGKVESENAHKVATEVLEKMVSGGANTPSILTGFDLGAGKFHATDRLNARPRAYYPKRP
jgi:hypothetical protein